MLYFHSNSDKETAAIGYRDQYPGLLRGKFFDPYAAEMGVMPDAVEEIDDLLANDLPLPTGKPQLLNIIYRGRKLALEQAPEERATTEFVDRWMKGGHIRLPGYIVGRHGISKVGVQTKKVAYWHEGVLYYAWGGMPGHRFPESAVGIPHSSFEQMITDMQWLLRIEKFKFVVRRNSLSHYTQACQSMPEGTRHERALKGGPVSLLRSLYGDCWDVAIKVDDLSFSTVDALRKSYRIGEVNSDRLGTKGKYILLSLEDAVAFKLRRTADQEPVPLLDISNPERYKK